jgi:hypothetical protein
MGDTGDDYRDMKEHRAEFRKKFGVACPGCKVKFPKAHPKILLPGQKCFCGHRDTRKERPQWNSPEASIK